VGFGEGSISQMEVAAAPSANMPMGGGSAYPRSMGTTSYAKVMEDSTVSAKVDEAAAQVMKSRDQVLAQLRKEAPSAWCGRARRDCVGRPV